MNKKIIILLTFFGPTLPLSPLLAHRSGCHRWHSCPSDSGSYLCGDLGYPCRYSTYSENDYSSFLGSLSKPSREQKVAGCTVVADTFDEVNNINKIYLEKFGRNCNCNELTFQVSHHTPRERLGEWLQQQDEGKKHQLQMRIVQNSEGKTVINRTNGKLYLIKDDMRHWAPDELTMYAHGLIYEDGTILDEKYINLIPEDTWLKYWEGQYYGTLETIKKGKAEALMVLPARLESIVLNYFQI